MPETALTNIRVVLCETSHPGNIGAVARAMKTMGLAELHLVNPRNYPDDQAQRRASHATDVLQNARVHASLDEALDGVALAVACTARPRDMAVAAFSAREAAARVVAVAGAQKTALVFGNETAGLTTEQVNKCGLIAYIPANPGYSSLNLGAAVQVMSYELRMTALGGAGADAEARVLAPHEDVEGFYAHLETALAQTGFFDPEHPKKLMPRVRRLFARAGLEPDEVNILRGILKALSGRRK
ncbi:MAG TPA: RNA methyltransferase [Burkholderiales bacterium]|nr:RNA methyltransferase [Burkholderiales bacterium]